MTEVGTKLGRRKPAANIDEVSIVFFREPSLIARNQGSSSAPEVTQMVEMTAFEECGLLGRKVGHAEDYP
jgi:hypothetical protein